MQVRERSWVSEHVPLDIFQAADVYMPSFRCLQILCYRTLVMHFIPIGRNVRKIWTLWAVLQFMKSSRISELNSISKVGFMVSQRYWRYKDISPWEKKHFKGAPFQPLEKGGHILLRCVCIDFKEMLICVTLSSACLHSA